MLLVALPTWCDIKILHGPYLPDLGEQETTIVWISDKTSVGWLEMALDDAGHFYAKRTEEELEHDGHKVIYGGMASTDVYGKEPLSFITMI